MNAFLFSRLTRSLFVMGTAGLLSSAMAGTVTYTGPTFGTWGSPSFWSTGSVPLAGDSVTVRNAGSVDLWVNANVSYSQPGLSSLLIDTTGSAWTILDITKSLISENVTVGATGKAAIEQNGGNQDLGNLVLGDSGTAGTGIYTLAKGNLATDNLTIGNVGTGRFDHLKGNVTVNGSFSMGNNSKLDSVYLLRKGNLTVGTATTIGDAGDGFFEQTKGTAALGALTLGNGGTGYGSYAQFGGTVRTDSATIGNAGAGFYGVLSGAHSVTGNLSLGAAEGGTGIYQIEGGALEVGGKILIGGDGEGGVYQMGSGKVSANGGVEVRAGEYQLLNTTLTTKGLSVSAGSHFITEGTKSTIRTTGNITFDPAATATTRDATLSVAKNSSISLSAVQADAGASFSAISASESWNNITLEKNVTLSLQGTAGVDAVYVNTLNIGSKDPFRVESIISGNGVNMYYNADLKANKYLKGDTYDLVNGGQLIPVHAPPASSSGGGLTISTGNWGTGGTGLVLVGSGSLVLSGSNTYSNGMIVIGGTGTIGGSYDAALDLGLAPGNSADTLSMGDFDFDGVLHFDFAVTDLFMTAGWTLDGRTLSLVSVTSPEAAEASGTLGEREFGHTPSTVPEPTSALLALLGSAALLARRTRR